MFQFIISSCRCHVNIPLSVTMRKRKYLTYFCESHAPPFDPQWMQQKRLPQSMWCLIYGTEHLKNGRVWHESQRRRRQIHRNNVNIHSRCWRHLLWGGPCWGRLSGLRNSWTILPVGNESLQQQRRHSSRHLHRNSQNVHHGHESRLVRCFSSSYHHVDAVSTFLLVRQWENAST